MERGGLAPSGALTWLELDAEALKDNVRLLKRRLPASARLAVAVKSNAYGHGLELAARAFIEGGADWLCVHSLSEASALRAAGLEQPIYVFGPTAPEALEEALALKVRLVMYSREQLLRLAELSRAEAEGSVKLHLKVETGNNRQGLPLPELLALAEELRAHPQLALEGLSSHFANVEDTTDHSYAERQLARFNEAYTALCERELRPEMRHIANSAATLLWPERAMEMARVGVSAYGLWPSRETQGVARQLALMEGRPIPALRPALTWLARVAQVKELEAGESIGYGCSFVTTRPSRIAVLPVGYFEGYDRGLSNVAHVLIHGQRAPVRGRVCMNMCMVDVSDIDGVREGDEAVLLGAQGDEELSAEQLASWANTINYEVVARIATHLPRRLRDH
jgi:alanine racemase